MNEQPTSNQLSQPALSPLERAAAQAITDQINRFRRLPKGLKVQDIFDSVAKSSQGSPTQVFNAQGSHVLLALRLTEVAAISNAYRSDKGNSQSALHFLNNATLGQIQAVAEEIDSSTEQEAKDRAAKLFDADKGQGMSSATDSNNTSNSVTTGPFSPSTQAGSTPTDTMRTASDSLEQVQYQPGQNATPSGARVDPGALHAQDASLQPEHTSSYPEITLSSRGIDPLRGPLPAQHDSLQPEHTPPYPPDATLSRARIGLTPGTVTIDAQFIAVASLFPETLLEMICLFQNNYGVVVPGVSVSFPVDNSGSLAAGGTCRMDILIRPELVDYIASEWFGTRTELSQGDRYLVFSEGQRILPQPRLKIHGCKRDIIPTLGPEISGAVSVLSQFKTERGQFKNRTDCILLDISSQPAECAVLNIFMSVIEGTDVLQKISHL